MIVELMILTLTLRNLICICNQQKINKEVKIITNAKEKLIQKHKIGHKLIYLYKKIEIKS